MCLACEEQQYFFLAWCEDFIARGEMPPGMTAEDLQAMGLPLPKPVAAGASAPERQTRAGQAAASSFVCDSPDE